jgi:hypothetical protein
MAKAKTETNFFDDEPSQVKKSDWLEIPSAPDHAAGFPEYPYTGAPVVLQTPDGEGVEAVWRCTRGFDTVQTKWVYSAYWAKRNSGGQKIEFEPIGYKVFVEPPLVGSRREEA